MILAFSAVTLLCLFSIGHAATQPGLSTGDSFCPSCVGNKYTDPVTNVQGCCPLGKTYQPAACVDEEEKINCPSWNGRLYTKNGATYKVYCDASAWISDLGVVPTADPQACVDKCISTPYCRGATYGGNNCYLGSSVDLHTGQPGSIAFVRQ
ncbi:hypothetical protein N7467_002269 [Penicillium canescens]|nr:hypothetical protein N7467_002269 [Penicillium canescens]